MKLRTLFLIAVTLLAGNVSAAENEAVKSGPEKFVQATSVKVISLLESNASGAEKQKRLTSMFLDVTDADWIGKFVLGKHWQGLSDDNKRRYLAAYRKYLVSSYVPKFREYNNQEIVIKGIKNLANDNYMVITDIVGGSYSTRVEYRIRSAGDGYKIRDIIAEGVSLLTTQRSEFSSIIESEGIEALITQLQEKAGE